MVCQAPPLGQPEYRSLGYSQHKIQKRKVLQVKHLTRATDFVVWSFGDSHVCGELDTLEQSTPLSPGEGVSLRQ